MKRTLKAWRRMRGASLFINTPVGTNAKNQQVICPLLCAYYLLYTCSREDRNTWVYTSTPLYIIMANCTRRILRCVSREEWCFKYVYLMAAAPWGNCPTMPRSNLTLVLNEILYNYVICLLISPLLAVLTVDN